MTNINKKVFIPLAIAAAVGISVVSVVSASADTDELNKDAVVQSEVDTLVSADDEKSNNNAEVQTELDRQFLNDHRMFLKKPTNSASISEEDAIKLASSYADVIASQAKTIKAEYQLLTNTDFTVFSENAKKKNQQLAKDGHLNETPVYIVTFKGVDLRSSGGVSRGGKTEHVIFHENNVVVDATSGEILFSYSNK
ncbi:hypothetical protein FHS18_004052 [Paenibacillus phyllosphaerae]|uniref:Uncharacterized protein n=1 Tax=Paenibacillus phyllosphaerae TaxID=274593 RepID=A0A7W5B0Q0_9BACL|nr:hypothetical protein [Paenibacillus phyllosphaerae]MBB3111984.1 hypothetical protein [Paenibacillus phyllosphaerae]